MAGRAWAMFDCDTSLEESFNETRIFSAIGMPITSHRDLPSHIMGESEKELHEYLLSPAWSYGFQSTEEYEQTQAVARTIFNLPYRIVFTHGDFQTHNILIDGKDRLSRFLDCECAGGVESTGSLRRR